jgi:hypothetical protein
MTLAPEILYAHLAALKGAVYLEMMTPMRHSSGVRARVAACTALGLPTKTSNEQVIAALKAKMQDLLNNKETGNATRDPN